ncbi:MAG: periplasmic heavy metal sensor [Bacteroidetes bacterium]|nr:periplasmic heavy metal sensor [Bacteroidota bacterium]
MDIFAQKKLLVRIVILLSLLNLFSIGVFIWKDFFHKHPPVNQSYDNRDVSDFLKSELNLTEKQIEQFRSLRTEFFEKEKILSNTMRDERDSMNQEMFNNQTNDDLVMSMAQRIAENEKKMELLRYEQAKQLKKICSSEQLEKFHYLVKEIRDCLKPDNK